MFEISRSPRTGKHLSNSTKSCVPQGLHFCWWIQKCPSFLKLSRALPQRLPEGTVTRDTFSGKEGHSKDILKVFSSRAAVSLLMGESWKMRRRWKKSVLVGRRGGSSISSKGEYGCTVLWVSFFHCHCHCHHFLPTKDTLVYANKTHSGSRELPPGTLTNEISCHQQLSREVLWSWFTAGLVAGSSWGSTGSWLFPFVLKKPFSLCPLIRIIFKFQCFLNIVSNFSSGTQIPKTNFLWQPYVCPCVVFFFWGEE